jgi:type IV pilus assembly protein PilW
MKRLSGFSLVEILVAMVIALLGTLIIFQVFAVSEGIKRTSTSGGDAQQFGALALYTMERYIRMAGVNVNNPELIGCNLLTYDELATPKTRPSFSLVPLSITKGATAKVADEITATFGSSTALSSPIKLQGSQIAATSAFNVENIFGFSPGDLIVAREDGKDCSMAEVTFIPPSSAANATEITHATGGYTKNDGTAATARYNSPTGLGVTYSTNGYVFNIGPTPTRSSFSILNNQLLMGGGFTTGTAMAVADNIVHMQAQYGLDNGVNNGTVPVTLFKADDSAVDSYSDTMPSSPTSEDWNRVIAVRLAVVARSALPEKPSVAGGACDATSASPTWAGGTFDLSTDANWQCFRYRVFETTVTLRNQQWKQLSSKTP